MVIIDEFCEQFRRLVPHILNPYIINPNFNRSFPETVNPQRLDIGIINRGD